MDRMYQIIIALLLSSCIPQSGGNRTPKKASSSLGVAPLLYEISTSLDEDAPVQLNLTTQTELLPLLTSASSFQFTVTPAEWSLQYDPATMMVSGTPGPNQFGEHVAVLAFVQNGRPHELLIRFLVSEINDPPPAPNFNLDIFRDTARSFQIPLPQDIEGDTVTLQISSLPSHGSISTDGVFHRYTPISGFVGTDSVHYTASDNRGGSSQGTILFNVGHETIFISTNYTDWRINEINGPLVHNLQLPGPIYSTITSTHTPRSYTFRNVSNKTLKIAAVVLPFGISLSSPLPQSDIVPSGEMELDFVYNITNPAPTTAFSGEMLFIYEDRETRNLHQMILVMSSQLITPGANAANSIPVLFRVLIPPGTTSPVPPLNYQAIVDRFNIRFRSHDLMQMARFSLEQVRVETSPYHIIEDQSEALRIIGSSQTNFYNIFIVDNIRDGAVAYAQIGALVQSADNRAGLVVERSFLDPATALQAPVHEIGHSMGLAHTAHESDNTPIQILMSNCNGPNTTGINVTYPVFLTVEAPPYAANNIMAPFTNNSSDFYTHPVYHVFASVFRCWYQKSMFNIGRTPL